MLLRDHKGRFRILKLIILFRKKETIDNVFFTSCILRNMFHAYDRLDELEADIAWAGPDGLHDPCIQSPTIDVSPVGGVGNNGCVETESAHDELKQLLITSYGYREKHNGIVWLRRSSNGMAAAGGGLS